MSVRTHITHFHDCGCLSKKYKEVIQDLLEVLKTAIEGSQTPEWFKKTALLIQKAQELQPRGE